MSRTLTEIENKFSELELRFLEIENMNKVLARQAKEYFILYNSTSQLNTNNGLKDFYISLDKIFNNIFNIQEYALIIKNSNADMLSINHSMGLQKRKLKEIFYRPGKGIVGKVYDSKDAIYIPKISELKKFTYFYMNKKIQGSLYYLPILDETDHCIGVVKMRKIKKDGFTEVERSVLPNLRKTLGIAIKNAQKIDILNSKSYMDELTGLFNRNYYKEHFYVEFKRAQRYRHNLSLIFIDLDNLKRINDLYGHSMGDKVLKSLGELLKSITRSSDICIRYGGDEFLILLPETSKNSSFEVAAKLNKAVESLEIDSTEDAESPNFSLSIGIASYPIDTIEPKMLIEMADRALYKAKSLGKNQIILAGEIE